MNAACTTELNKLAGDGFVLEDNICCSMILICGRDALQIEVGRTFLSCLLKICLEPMRLLLTEDDPEIARVISKGLREHGYAVDIAGDGEQALYNAAVHSYD